MMWINKVDDDDFWNLGSSEETEEEIEDYIWGF